MGITASVSRAVKNLKLTLGLERVQIFGEEPPYSNPHGFETTPQGVPIVPQDEVIQGGLTGTKKVFSGGLITSGAGENTFIARTDMGAPSLRDGDLFAFRNQDPSRPSLVFEVINSGKKCMEIETQDIGFLEGSAEGL